MKQKCITYVTYAPQHSKRARGVIQKLKQQRPGDEFTGRSSIGFTANKQRINAEIERSTTTIVLVGAGTFDDAAVEYDIRLSRAKQPPNEILMIMLEESLDLPEQSPLLGLLEECGSETIGISGDVQGAIQRLHLRVDRGEKIVATVGAPSCGTCGR